MTLDEALAVLALVAQHPVEGTGHTMNDGYLTADFFIDDEAELDPLVDALHGLSEAASIVVAVINDRRVFLDGFAGELRRRLEALW